MAAGGIPPNANKAGGVTDRRDFEASFRYAPFGFKIFPHLRIHYFGCFPTALFLTFPIIIPNTGSNGRALCYVVGLFSFIAALAAFTYYKKRKTINHAPDKGAFSI